MHCNKRTPTLYGDQATSQRPLLPGPCKHVVFRERALPFVPSLRLPSYLLSLGFFVWHSPSSPPRDTSPCPRSFLQQSLNDRRSSHRRHELWCQCRRRASVESCTSPNRRRESERGDITSTYDVPKSTPMHFHVLQFVTQGRRRGAMFAAHCSVRTTRQGASSAADKTS